MKQVLAHDDTRIAVADLNDDLLRTLREAVDAEEANNIGKVRALLAKVRGLLTPLERYAAETK